MVIDSFKGVNNFLSNFYQSLVVFEGKRYPSVEHAFQAAKTTDLEARKVIASLPTASDAKKAGRRVSLREDWEQVKFDVMGQCLISKFSDPTLLGMLKQTGDAVLIEGNHWHDNYWGDCSCGAIKCKFEGANLLGRMLMAIRDENK